MTITRPDHTVDAYTPYGFGASGELITETVSINGQNPARTRGRKPVSGDGVDYAARLVQERGPTD